MSLIFALTSDEMAFLLGKVGLPPLDGVTFPRVEGHPLPMLQTLHKAGQRLQQRGLLRESETSLQVPAGLVQLLHTAVYPEQWMRVLLHDREKGLLQRSWYRDGKGRIAFHQVVDFRHMLAPGPRDMGHESLLELLESYRSSFNTVTTPASRAEPAAFPVHEWQAHQKRRLSWENDTTRLSNEHPFWQDFLTAPAVLVWQRLYSITPLWLEESAYILGPHLWRVSQGEEPNLMQAEPISWEALFTEVKTSSNAMEQAWERVQALLQRLRREGIASDRPSEISLSGGEGV